MSAFITGNYSIRHTKSSVIVQTDDMNKYGKCLTHPRVIEDQRTIAYLPASSSFSLDERQATALLFAAAPNMFAALEKAEFEMRYAGWHKPEAICCRQDAYNLVKDALRAAQEAA